MSGKDIESAKDTYGKDAPQPGPVIANGPYAVVVAGKGGNVTVGDWAVGVVGLESRGHDGTEATICSGRFGASIGSMDGKTHARTGSYGVAVTGKESDACGGPGAIVAVGDNSWASVADGGVAYVRGYRGRALSADGGVSLCAHQGIAQAVHRGIARVEAGVARTETWGLSMVRTFGLARAGDEGIAIAWNEPAPAYGHPGMPTDFCAVSAGQGGVVVAFMDDPKAVGRRRAVIGFVGPADAGPPRVQFDLQPNAYYRLDEQTGRFEAVILDEPPLLESPCES